MSDSVSGFTKLAQGGRGCVKAAVTWLPCRRAGKALGVVAQEVRALAQRGAQSSKEIRELMQNTVDALAGCSSHARRAG